jgi:hypothetical protein
MRSMTYLAIGFASLAASQFAYAITSAPPQAAVATDSVLFTKARKLAQILNPLAQHIALTERVIDTSLATAFHNQASFKALEVDYPGITDAVIAAIKPEMISQIKADIPKLWDTLATFYAPHFSSLEFDELIGFFGGPIGQKVIDSAFRSQYATEIMDVAVNNGSDKQISQAAQRDIQKTAQRVVAKMTDAEMRTLAQFGYSPVGRKMIALTKEKQQIEIDWGLQTTPEEDARVAKISKDTLESYIAKIKAAKAEAAKQGAPTPAIATTAKKTN